MPSEITPPPPTACTSTQLHATLRNSWRAIVGTEPTRQSLIVMLAQWSLECAHGAKCFGWNLGNRKHVDGDGFDWCTFETFEYLNGKKVVLRQQFCVFPSIESGSDEYVKLLRGQFGFAWPAVESGDVADFSHRLKIRNYYTAPEATYTAGMLAVAHVIDREIGPETVPDLASILALGRDEREVNGPTVDDDA